MSADVWLMLAMMALTFGTLAFLVFVLIKSMRNERDRRRSVWREFGLSLALVILFFVSWIAQGISEWQTYSEQQREHNQPADVGNFIWEFGQSTTENWQSEFLQLFSFVVLAGLYIHKGSAESKDSDEKMEASLRRIEEKLGTLPDDAPTKKAEAWKLPDTPLKASG